MDATKETQESPRKDIQAPEEISKYTPQQLVTSGDSQRIADLTEQIDALNSAGWLSPAQAAELNSLLAQLDAAQQTLADATTASAVLDALNALPYPSQVVASDRAQIEAASALYHSLSATQQAMLPAAMVEKLEACLSKLP